MRRSFDAGGSPFSLVCKTLTIQPGERVAITGPSGCGKSTLLALLALALRPEDGASLSIAGQDAMPLWQDLDRLASCRAEHIGFVPQTGALLPFLTLRDNIGLPLRILGRPDPARVAALAARLGIAAILDRLPAAVSVGQRQRAAIARALVHRPGIILADEPTAAVHPAQADDILALLAESAMDGATLIIATHDAPRAASAGFTLAPCQADPGAAVTRLSYPCV